MEGLIVIAWFLMAVTIPLGFIVVSYKAYVYDSPLIDIIAKLILALIIYGVFTVPMFYVMFLIIYAGAHTNPVGNALDTRARFFVSGFVLVYGLVGWLLCSLINGRLIRPNRSWFIETGKSPSIFNGN